MEADQTTPTQPQQSQPQKYSSTPDFPSRRDREKSKSKLVIIIPAILLIAIVAAGAWFFLIKKPSSSTPTPTPTPTPTITFEDTLPASTEEPEAVKVDKSDIQIEVLNGTGISGEASYLQGKLGALDYTQIDVGNASSQDNTKTQVSFSSNIPEEVQEEIKGELEGIYNDVSSSTSSSLTDDNIRIITGLRKGQTPKPSETEAPSSPTPTPSSTTSPTATPTASPTPTPTG